MKYMRAITEDFIEVEKKVRLGDNKSEFLGKIVEDKDERNVIVECVSGREIQAIFLTFMYILFKKYIYIYGKMQQLHYYIG